MQPQHEALPGHGVKHEGGVSGLFPGRGAPAVLPVPRGPAGNGQVPPRGFFQAEREEAGGRARGSPTRAALRAHSASSSAVPLSSVQFLVFKAKSQDLQTRGWSHVLVKVVMPL